MRRWMVGRVLKKGRKTKMLGKIGVEKCEQGKNEDLKREMDERWNKG